MTNDKQVKGAADDPGVALARELLKQKPNYAVPLDAMQTRILATWLLNWPLKLPSFGASSVFFHLEAPASGFGPGDIRFLRDVVRFNNGPVSAEEYISTLKTPIDTATKPVDAEPRSEQPLSPPALGSVGESTDSKPAENGYVPKPVDPTAYVSQASILAEHIPLRLPISEKQLPGILEDYSGNRIRWTRPLTKSGNPNPQRRSIHLNDWLNYIKRIGSSDPSPDELAYRKSQIREGNRLRGK